MPDCRDYKKGLSCQCHLTLHDIKLKFYYIPNLFRQCGWHVQYLDIRRFNDSTVLRSFKGCFPNLVELKIMLHQWKDEDMKDLFDGITKLEHLYVTWHHGKPMPLTFLEAVNGVAKTLKILSIWNAVLHVNPRLPWTMSSLDDSYWPDVCIN